MDDATKLVDSFSHIAWWLLVVALLVWLRFSKTGSTARSSLVDFLRNRNWSAEVLGQKFSAQVANLDAEVLEKVGALEERLDALATALKTTAGEETSLTSSAAVRSEAWRPVAEALGHRRQMVEEILLLADWDHVQHNEWRPWARSGMRMEANDQYEGFLSLVKARAAAGSVDRMLVVVPERIMPMMAGGLRVLREIREISPMPPTVIYAPEGGDITTLDELARRYGALGAASSLNGIDNLLRPRGLTIIGPELAHGR